ncbi:uncharacterized protein N7482_008224 [Penicillium canariense]|uniref:Uncharacterized protein n=1 Tax=Penicillium canariense TaxID=189055 RepID=A0A9W9LI57_9EURO|nr:uncharacterized protein N7482_008224 [Penicillium canariense]KAJ5157124.1 hypothetical protein N7482_008224 [Penicillium canariense]
MAPKGNITTRLNPLRLNTINHLRVRRPNQNEQNACVTVMSSMLSTYFPGPLHSGLPRHRLMPSLPGYKRAATTIVELLTLDELLTTVCCNQTAGLPKGTATRAAPLLRRNCASAWTHRYVSPSVFFHLPQQPADNPSRTLQKSQEKKKNTVNYHLMRMYPKVVGPRKKDGVLG